MRRTLVEEVQQWGGGNILGRENSIAPCVTSNQPDAFGNNLALPENEMEWDMSWLELWLER